MIDDAGPRSLEMPPPSLPPGLPGHTVRCAMRDVHAHAACGPYAHSKDPGYPGPGSRQAVKVKVKAKYKHIDIVFMNGLSTRYYVAEEDAELIHKLDSKKEYRPDISYFLTSIGRNEKKKFIGKLTEQNKGYVFMDMKKPITDPVMRIIVDSSDKELIGDEEY